MFQFTCQRFCFLFFFTYTYKNVAVTVTFFQLIVVVLVSRSSQFSKTLISLRSLPCFALTNIFFRLYSSHATQYLQRSMLLYFSLNHSRRFREMVRPVRRANLPTALPQFDGRKLRSVNSSFSNRECKCSILITMFIGFNLLIRVLH